MERFLPILRAFCADNGLPLTARQEALLTSYAEFLVQYNQSVNLTAITEPEEMAVKHFADSLSLLTAAQPAGKVLDVGTGAGFPGMVLRLFCPEAAVTLMDSVGKKTEFLRQLAERLQTPVTILCGRAEDFAQRQEQREQYDFVTARAVAALPTLCEYCLPFVRVGGCFAAMKGASCSEELQAARHAIDVLGGRLEKEAALTLPDGSRRGILLIRKISQTPTKYPRNGGQISKKPL